MELMVLGHILDVKLIGEGNFARAYRHEENVILCVEDCRYREGLSQAPCIPHLPIVDKLEDGKYLMPYYEDISNHTYYQKVSSDLHWGLVRDCKGDDRKFLVWVLDNYPQYYEAIKYCYELTQLDPINMSLEFQDYNMGIDKDGNLILRDIVYDFKARECY